MTNEFESHPIDSDELAVEQLLTRLMDGESTPEDRESFERSAAAEPSLWRSLAVRQQDMLDLRVGLERAIGSAIDVPLPRRRILPDRMTLPLVLSGWAAVIIISMAWTLMAINGQSSLIGPGTLKVNVPTPTLAQSYNTYMHDAPYVIGELDPVVTDVEQLSDGRVAVNFIRRIEEVLLLDPDQALPVDENGVLLTDPEKLRQFEPQVRPLEELAAEAGSD